jgi:hypothetical protein
MCYVPTEVTAKQAEIDRLREQLELSRTIICNANSSNKRLVAERDSYQARSLDADIENVRLKAENLSLQRRIICSTAFLSVARGAMSEDEYWQHVREVCDG